ncbi:2',3'-cyclic nucleotide 3'-phosphodiesterase [Alternaria postmessia]|uniref:2',3'-cyclic nucleotide 3'-phosphodiesterase n=1 Tax=Alternaria postmessia TaxID=1187938 RepID=UPI002224BF8A|nr:2',3'-cyclic nucleotide 3'-phosphodiesterase [Alternaria postmessia]KAI5374737.1 2',3'-cyclic nucleotide 3'-phosphodiesterase [Alternaria postmessia]
MPGSSLWLLPPADHPLNEVLPRLIDKTSKQFNSPHRFLPHVTLTSEISPSKYGSDPQAWLESLDLPSGQSIQIKFERLGSEDVFFRKLYIKCAKAAGIKQLAQQCRSHVNGFEDETNSKTWAEEQYMPHLSLMYHDCNQVDETGLASVDTLEVNFEERGELGGWSGGRVVLVPTDKPILQWQPIGERTL